jgi:RimJ/RimL family protein N-acetyltransferase
MTESHIRNAVAIGERIYLRLSEPGDGEALSLASHLEPEVEFSDAGRIPTSALAFTHWLESLNQDAVPREFSFAICRIDDGACIGVTSVRDIDWVNQTAETGAGLLSAEDRGHGLGPEAKHLLLRYCFETLGLHAVRAMVFAENVRSAAALRRQGYRRAGRLSASIQKGGTYYDDVVFDVLRPEWEAAYAAWKQRDPAPHSSS